jgi:hypothetical protein
MTLYLESQAVVGVWPEPLETVWQVLGGEPAGQLAPKLPHLGLVDILFMTTVMSLARAERPWGIVTWMAEVFAVSRPGLYALTQRVKERLLAEQPPVALLGSGAEPTRTTIELSPNRLARTILTAACPGKMAIRPTQRLLAEAFDQSRSVGWISELLREAGGRAGQVLGQIDTTALKNVIVARDETFFQGQPLLLIIDPVSTTILLAQACPDRQADTWGAALLLAQEQGATIRGVVEDMARMYPKSQQEAELELAVQKDSWHIQRDGSQVRRDLERAAFRATHQVLTLEKELLKQWDDQLFAEKYIPAVAKEERLYDQHDQFAHWLAHLHDALELVDWRSGEIRDRATNDWLLSETLTAMAKIDHPRVKKWVKTLRRHQSQLLTCLDWLAGSLQPCQDQLAQLLPQPARQQLFSRTVARSWRLEQALINGHTHFRSQAQEAKAALQSLLADYPELQPLADRLLTLLDAACRTSSLIENINGLLQQFLHQHRAFRNLDTLQLYLNLFTLWHNMRIFERGKRQGQSPYQIAGIDPGADDWLALLGYPAE